MSTATVSSKVATYELHITRAVRCAARTGVEGVD